MYYTYIKSKNYNGDYMLTTFTAALSPMLVLFTCIIVGFVLAKLKLIPEESAMVLSKLEYYVFGPALTFNTLAENMFL